MFYTCSLMNDFHRFWVTFRHHFGTKMVPKSVTGALLEVTWASKALSKGFKKRVQKKTFKKKLRGSSEVIRPTPPPPCKSN